MLIPKNLPPLPGYRKPPKPKIKSASEESPATPSDFTSLLPGVNEYDKSVIAGQISGYAEARNRKGLEIDQEKLKQAQLATESLQLEVKQKRGELISREDVLSRQDSLISAFRTVMDLMTQTAVKWVPPHDQDKFNKAMQAHISNGLSTIADCITHRRNREQTDAAIHSMFIR